MLAVLGLGTALPVAGSLPHANATMPESSLVIAGPVLNSGISWLDYSSAQPMNSVPILVGLDNRITIDLSTHFPSDHFVNISATSSDPGIASVDVIRDQTGNDNKLIVIPYGRGQINIELKAQYNVSQAPEAELETVKDTIELYINKNGI